MRAVLQRVSHARVSVDGQTVGQIGAGLMILVCAMQGDDDTTAQRLATKIAKLRIFKDEAGKMNIALPAAGNAALVISQFTLAADLRGNRPGFSTAAPPEMGNRLYETFCAALAQEGIDVRKGVFGADMDVELLNQGPVTIWMDTDAL